MRMFKHRYHHSIKAFYEKNARYLSPAALFCGFLLDSFTLRRIDLLAENLLIIAYLFVAGASIVFLNAHHAGRFSHRWFDTAAGAIPFLLQFAFGGLFSVFVVFYSRSASLMASWPFLLALAVLLIGNEVFQKKYQRLTFQVSIFFTALYSYAVFATPILLGKIGAGVFLLSGFFSLLLITFFLSVLYKLARARMKHSFHYILISVGGIYLTITFSYFLNIIPPIPLALKESGIYHRVERGVGGYAVSFEPAPWYVFSRDYHAKVHWQRGLPLYAYSAIFAPTKISTTILHRWSHYDVQKEEWITKDILRYPIVGGRDGGYRGYSLKYALASGKWKVEVITERGQVLGRMRFTVIESKDAPELERGVK